MTRRRLRRLAQASAAILAAALTASGALAQTADGKAIYKSANCVGCHKWHGDGGGGYGGAAVSLRGTALEREHLIEVVRCGRPGTRMPYHDRKAWQGTDCYGETRDSFGSDAPPRAAKFLRPYQVEAVVDYVMDSLMGGGQPSKADCIAFWGEGARECSRFD